MPVYRTTLVRAFSVVIDARDEVSAARLSEVFVGFSDDSNSIEKEKFNFEIQEIELIQNDVLETRLLEEINTMPKNPLAEVFGFPVSNMSQDAVNHREGRLCPYHNPSGLNCTKSSATDPLGVCSIVDNNKIVVTCLV